MNLFKSLKSISGSEILFLIAILLLTSCKPNIKEDSGNKYESYYQSINNWKLKRIKNLKGHNGWLNLAGLFWLEEGTNSVGSHPDNSIIFPEGSPDFLGSFNLINDRIEFTSNPNTIVLHKGEPINRIDMRTDMSGDPIILTHDSLAWFIIKREDRFGIRLRDFNKPEIKDLDSIPCFDVDLIWKVEARFIPSPSIETISVPNVLGHVDQVDVPGILEFILDNKKFELYPMGKPDNLWVVFGDETSAEETYGGGRFLGIDGPDEKGTYIIDFNKAYNPPCAFTPFATCPLPPKENLLGVRVTAGEKNVPHNWH